MFFFKSSLELHKNGMEVAFVHGGRACAVISMASKRDVLFATQYYGTYDCSKQVHIFVKHLLILRGNS